MPTIPTSRLELRALTRDQLLQYLDQPEQLENELGITLARPVLTETTQRAIRMKTQKMSAAPEQDHTWYTYWLIILSKESHGAGLIGYKGLIAGQEGVDAGSDHVGNIQR